MLGTHFSLLHTTELNIRLNRAQDSSDHLPCLPGEMRERETPNKKESCLWKRKTKGCCVSFPCHSKRANNGTAHNERSTQGRNLQWMGSIVSELEWGQRGCNYLCMRSELSKMLEVMRTREQEWVRPVGSLSIWKKKLLCHQPNFCHRLSRDLLSYGYKRYWYDSVVFYERKTPE